MQFLLLPSSGLFYLKVTNMLKTEPFERNVISILPNCNVCHRRSGCRLGFTKSRDVTRALEAMAVAKRNYRDICFENRKRRPQERGRKKRRKGKWNPIDRLWNSANHKECGPIYLLEQD
jgi:hypothetical protein